jgi:flagellar P-ring protein precursor FlgI
MNNILKLIFQILKVSSLLVTCLMTINQASADRLKDLATIQGVRNNQLIGYGLVVGLDGTGDQTTQVPFTTQTTISMLQQMGVKLPPDTNLTQIQMKNIAAVMVTTDLPAFAQVGQNLDITVSSMANAKSLRGGTLLMTPLKGADGQVYALAQGNLVVAGAGASASGSSTQVNQLSVGRISAGATVERTVPFNIAFSTAAKVVNAINSKFGNGIAMAQDARVISVRPNNADGKRVAFLAELESIEVTPAKGIAKVILNARTGSVVLNENVLLENCAVSHGNLSVVINTAPVISQPGAFSNGTTVSTKVSAIEINKEPGNVIQLGKGTSLTDVVSALNAIGATPQDLLAILQAIKAAGALHADLEVI